MPKSSPAELSALRSEVFERDGGCIWLGCDTGQHLELAHIKHRGMGGSVEANRPDNCVTLCQFHHAVFDGRTTTRYELGQLLLRIAGVVCLLMFLALPAFAHETDTLHR